MRNPRISIEHEINLMEHLDDIPTRALEDELRRRRVNGDQLIHPEPAEEESPERELLGHLAFRVRVLGMPLEHEIDELMLQHEVDWQLPRPLVETVYD